MKKITMAVSAAFAVFTAQSAMAACTDVTRPELVAAVSAAATANADSGYPLTFWVTMVDESGKVCHVVTNGDTGALAGNSSWLGSRVISAQKANTANAFSLDNYAISTANLYSAVQPGGSLYGLQHSNPVDTSRAYGGSPSSYGKESDFLKNKRIGGVNVFGGGLALYSGGKKVGAIGVSGDTSCADHIFAWEVRNALNKEPVDAQDSALSGLLGADQAVGITTVNFAPNGDLYADNGGDFTAIGTQGDEMVINAGVSYWSAWEHPVCPNTNTSHAGVINLD